MEALRLHGRRRARLMAAPASRAYGRTTARRRSNVRAQFADKPRLTDEELADLERRARELFTPESDAVFGDGLYLALLAQKPAGRLGATGTYSQNWLPDRYFEHRTSLIVDPADGRLPPPTAEGERARSAAASRFARRPAAAQDMTITDRCIHYGFPDLFAAYMSVYRIVQTPEYVAIQMEKIHDVRIIPLDGRPHIPSAMRQYLGEPAAAGRATRSWSRRRTFIPTETRWADMSRSPIRICGSSSASGASLPIRSIHLHRGQPDDVDETVDGSDQLEAVEGRGARVRLPRRELQLAWHAQRGARGRGSFPVATSSANSQATSRALVIAARAQ